ncbi:MAG: WD40 repeat domain-containing protein [Candidatus Kariarchaeaceae archaeon]|jgi:WD40 repeat protein
MTGVVIPFHPFTGHTGEILDVCISSDSKRIYYAVNDGTIRVLDFDTKKLIHVFHCLNGFPISISLSFDNRFLAAADNNANIEVWDLVLSKKIEKLRAYDKEIFTLEFSTKDYFLFSSGESDEMILKQWKLDKNFNLKLNKEMELDDEVHQIIVSAKNESILAVGEDMIYHSNFNLNKSKNQIEYEGIVTANISADSKFIYGGDTNGRIIIWNAKKGKQVDVLEEPADKHVFGKAIYAMALSSNYVIFGDRNKIKIWDLEAKSVHKEFKSTGKKEDKDKFNTTIIAPNNEYFVVGGSQRLRIGDLKEGKWIKAIRRPPLSPPYYDDYTLTAISPDFKYLIGIRDKIEKSTISEIIEVWELSSRTKLHEIHPPIEEGGSISCLAIALNNKFFVTGDDTDSSEARAIIWDIKTGKAKKTLQDLDYGVNSLIISHDSKYIISSDQTFDIEIWDVRSGKLVKKLSESTKNISYFALSDDLQYLVCAFRDVLDRQYDIVVFDLEIDKMINELSANIDWDDKIVWTGFSKDQKYLYARSEQGYLINWEFKSGKYQNKIEDQDNYILYNPFSDVNVYPLAENLILHISDKCKELSPYLRSFLKLVNEKSEWIMLDNEVFSLRKNCSEEQTNVFNSDLESLLS